MSYSKQTWADDAVGGTPITAARLSNIEDGIASVDTRVSAATDLNTPGTLVKRSAGGYVGFQGVSAADAPANPSDLTRKDYVDTKVAGARQVIAGTGLTGGGDLTADRTLAVSYGTTAGTAAQGNDTRIVNAVQTADSRVTADQATASIRTIGTGALQAAAGNHTHTSTGISDSTTTGRALMTAASAAAARTTLAAPSVSGGVTDIVQLTQAAYTALGAGTVATTLYVIVG